MNKITTGEGKGSCDVVRKVSGFLVVHRKEPDPASAGNQSNHNGRLPCNTIVRKLVSFFVVLVVCIVINGF